MVQGSFDLFVTLHVPFEQPLDCLSVRCHVRGSPIGDDADSIARQEPVADEVNNGVKAHRRPLQPAAVEHDAECPVWGALQVNRDRLGSQGTLEITSGEVPNHLRYAIFFDREILDGQICQDFTLPIDYPDVDRHHHDAAPEVLSLFF
jgi:hypothetical protein